MIDVKSYQIADEGMVIYPNYSIWAYNDER